jgi:hypothetical protein
MVHLDPKEAARVSAEAVATLAQAMTKSTDPGVLQSLAQGLSAVLNQEPAAHRSQRVRSVTGAVGLGGTSTSLLLPVLDPALAPLPEPLPAMTLVELLKQSLCVGEARRAVLDALGTRYHRHFTDQWDFVHFAEEQKLGLDFTTPPQQSAADR